MNADASNDVSASIEDTDVNDTNEYAYGSADDMIEIDQNVEFKPNTDSKKIPDILLDSNSDGEESASKSDDFKRKKRKRSSRRNRKNVERKSLLDDTSSSSDVEFQDDIHKVEKIEEIENISNNEVSFQKPKKRFTDNFSDASAEPMSDETHESDEEQADDKENEERKSENGNETKNSNLDSIISSLRNLSSQSINRNKPAFPLPSSKTLEMETANQHKEKDEEIPEKISGICLYRVKTPIVEDNFGIQQVHPVISVPPPPEADFPSTQDKEEDEIMEILRVKEEVENVETNQPAQNIFPPINKDQNKSPRRAARKDFYHQTTETICQLNNQDGTSSLLTEMKQLALDKRPLPSVADEYFIQLIEMLTNDKYELLQKRLFEEASCVSGALEFAQTEFVRIKKERLFQDAQAQHKNNVEQMQKEIQEFNNQTQKMLSQMKSDQDMQKAKIIEQQENESVQLMQVWGSEQKLRQYNKASQKLIQNRAQYQILCENSRFDEAKVLQKTIQEMEEEEMMASHAQMQRDFDIAADNLKRKHELELSTFESKIEAQNQQFMKKRETAKIPLELKQKRIEAQIEKVNDPEKLWNRCQMQKKEENVAIMLSRSNLPLLRPTTRAVKPKPNTVISLPPLDMSKGRKMTKTRLPPLPSSQ